MNIGILSNNNPKEATYRITIQALIKSLKEENHTVKDISEFTQYPDILFTIRHMDPFNSEIENFLNDCKKNKTVICTYINDVYKEDDSKLIKWAQLSDILFCPTEYHKLAIESFCDTRVEILPDSIDYLIDKPYRKQHHDGELLKVCWFGSPESYSKSMSKYQPTIDNLINKGVIEYTIISNFPSLPPHINYIPFNNITFCEDLKQFDIGILSHTPLDYSLNTFIKSPNKLTLAISLGIPCVVSRTPSYRSILKDCQLEEYCFSSPLELENNMKKLFSSKQRNQYLKKSQDIIIKKYNYKNLGKIFLHEINRT